MNKQNIIIAVTGASGAIYAYRLIQKLKSLKPQLECLSLIFSENAKIIWQEELNKPLPVEKKIKIYDNNNFYAPIASGSHQPNTMVIVPASMGIIGRIANGISDDLITRAADVILKEHRKLIVVPRETPFNLIHLRNMETLTLAGTIICPASPSFYQKPQNINALTDTVVDRIIDLMHFEQKTFRWGE